MYRNLLVPLCALIAVLAVLSVPATAARSAPAAVADPCAQLQPDDLRYDAPDLVAVVLAQQGSCFALPDPAGTVYQLERIGTDEVVFLDAEGLPACLPSPENTGRCELDGRAPFRMDVPAQPYRGAPVQLRFAVFRLTGDTGCPRLPVSAYGRAREASFTGLDGGWLCLDLPASPTRVPLLSQAAAPFVPPPRYGAARRRGARGVPAAPLRAPGRRQPARRDHGCSLHGEPGGPGVRRGLLRDKPRHAVDRPPAARLARLGHRVRLRAH
ncbi:hypothetical protein GCM10023226_04460 [Nocardioides nanhaiensis]|uniref:Uncharacterized protein n=1 Tax=Nocardioides nanhaiensis TaxID=1476871 RepID=A0ABP8VUK0_9ACTN